MISKLISIIIPVYNIEKYVERCIMSLCNQTYSNLEIIIIDDGSADNSLSICKNIRDSRIKIYSQINKGVSSARNFGLKVANGEYIIFVDGDDYLEKNMIEELHKNIIKYKVDISICNYKSIFNKEERLNTSNSMEIVLNKNDFVENLLEKNTFRGYLWNKLIKREVIKNVKFDENIHIMEDLIFLLEISSNIKKVYYDSNLYLYNYVQRENSSLKKVTSKYLSILNAFPIIFKYISIKSELYNIYMFDYISSSMLIYCLYNDLTKDEKKKIINIRNINFKYAMMSKNNTISKKIKLIIMSYFPIIYKILKKYDRGE